MNEITERPWGTYRIIEESDKYKIKEIIVNSGKRISLQSHEKRDELWKLISGKWKITLGTLNIVDIDRVIIKRGNKHRVENIDSEPLVFIEIQTGDSFDESDVIRYEDDYGRVKLNDNPPKQPEPELPRLQKGWL